MRANNSLCDNGAPLMFVTAFVGILDLKTGKVAYVNAGHCPPLLQTKNGYEYVEVIRNVVLGVMPNYEYKVGQISMKEHERLFLYTDGVTEAKTEDNKFLGEAHLLDILNARKLTLADTLEHVYKSIKKFVKSAPQFDDITMLALDYGPRKEENS
jgi:sigma-B regulation protein RsbU (phosphoserine phosphatase)